MIKGTLDNLETSNSWAPHNERPPIAVELAPEGILAASLSADKRSLTCSFLELSDGDLLSGYAEANIRNPAAIAQALRGAVAPFSSQIGSSVSIIIPDSAARVFILPFESLPTDRAELESLLRFRLRKLARFDVDTATLDFQVFPSESKIDTQASSAFRVLAVIVPSAIVLNYESVVRSAGFQPGALLPSTLASLRAFNFAEGAILVNVSSCMLTTCIGSGNELMLYRAVELPMDHRSRIEEVERSLAVSVAWYEDRFGTPPERFCYNGCLQKGEEPAILPRHSISTLLTCNDDARPNWLGLAAVIGALGAGVPQTPPILPPAHSS